ncbi:FAD-dependent oxidoreductase [Algibacter aquimarinus]|uniref:Amine oxidase domain-containing protein n=1 Tax=Algibacter aquimarinus TaxID=1136748 RepID=A0ABP9HBQ2_9FLAO
MKKVIIIGAGPAGLSCAYQLSKENFEVIVFEASNNIGGMSRSFQLWGQIVDLGPHRFFSKQPDVNRFFNELIKEDFTLVNRQTRIFYNGKYFQYPLKIGNVLKNLSFITIFQILWDYFIKIVFPLKNTKNLEEWISNRFGKKLYTIFFKHYSEKLWGIKCTQIDADWAAQRIKTLSLAQAVISAFLSNKGNKHKTLVDQFAYPNNGTGTLYERAAEAIKKQNSNIHFNSKIKRVLLDESNKIALGVELLNGDIIESDYVISTMPLTSLLKGFNNTPKKVIDSINTLYFRNTILVYLEIDKENLFSDNWLYIHSPDVKLGRITNFRNWCPSLNKGKSSTIIALEYWCFESDTIWSEKDKNIIEMAVKELHIIDLLDKNVTPINSKIIRVPNCYPVYETGYQQNLDIVIKHLKKIENLLPIGRYGSFKYNNQDHSILMGLLAAKKITNNDTIDLWSVNTDTEYQEDAKVKDVLIY